jgi:hypothetical protein
MDCNPSPKKRRNYAEKLVKLAWTLFFARHGFVYILKLVKQQHRINENAPNQRDRDDVIQSVGRTDAPRYVGHESDFPPAMVGRTLIFWRVLILQRCWRVSSV